MNNDKIPDATTPTYYLHSIYIEAKTWRHLYFGNTNVTAIILYADFQQVGMSR